MVENEKIEKLQCDILGSLKVRCDAHGKIQKKNLSRWFLASFALLILKSNKTYTNVISTLLNQIPFFFHHHIFFGFLDQFLKFFLHFKVQIIPFLGHIN